MASRAGTDARRASGPSTPLGNERGAILIIVLVMLVLLSILGATVFTTTTAELGMSATYRRSQEIFTEADAAIEYVMTNDAFHTGGDSVSTVPSFSGKSSLSVQVKYLRDETNVSGSGSEIRWSRYVVSATTAGTGANDPAQANVEAHYLKMNAAHTTSIFYDTGD